MGLQTNTEYGIAGPNSADGTRGCNCAAVSRGVEKKLAVALESVRPSGKLVTNADAAREAAEGAEGKSGPHGHPSAPRG